MATTTAPDNSPAALLARMRVVAADLELLDAPPEMRAQVAALIARITQS